MISLMRSRSSTMQTITINLFSTSQQLEWMMLMLFIASWPSRKWSNVDTVWMSTKAMTKSVTMVSWKASVLSSIRNREVDLHSYCRSFMFQGFSHGFFQECLQLRGVNFFSQSTFLISSSKKVSRFSAIMRLKNANHSQIPLNSSMAILRSFLHLETTRSNRMLCKESSCIQTKKEKCTMRLVMITF